MENNNSEQTLSFPRINGEKVTFIYRGEAQKVCLVGDYNSWELEDWMVRQDNSDIWRIQKTFPVNARFDYKYVVDGNWITDPLNPNTTQVGAGMNSTLMMPGYRSDFDKIMSETCPQGTLLLGRKLDSRYMDKEMTYHVYLPPNFKLSETKHILYALDGSDYVNHAKINIMLDYLIAHQQIPQMAAVLIDPDDRNRDYTIYEPYYRYVTEELIPFSERECTEGNCQRALIGVSWGGLTAFHIAFQRPHTFQRMLTQSGSYWPRDWKIFNTVNDAPFQPLKLCIQTGTIQDTEEMNDAMVQLLIAKGYAVTYNKYAETHSWSNWKGHLSEGLTALYAH